MGSEHFCTVLVGTERCTGCKSELNALLTENQRNGWKGPKLGQVKVCVGLITLDQRAALSVGGTDISFDCPKQCG